MGPGTLGALDQHARNLIALRLSGCDGPGGVERFWRLCVLERVGETEGGREREREERGTLRCHLGQEPPAPLPHVLWVRETLPSFGVVCTQQQRARATF